ncbi:hypothetical protein Poly51_10770 [Rubripirellula tenax]|uniref:Uncharacterized protein n=2 Tax=Rubripirellula tenax TaxID=2528015 RepID=A0A5C6FG85_9BACT|nr:hypothetical protein Poly51_10770 [Rubripirellula tenax]
MCVGMIAFGSFHPLAAQSPGEMAAEQARMEAEMAASAEYGSEYEEMDGYGGYGGGYGSPYGGGSAQSDATQTYLADLVSLVDGFKLSPLFAPDANVDVQTGPVLSREADQAFAAGNPAIALALMCGHMATEFDEAGPVIGSVQFSPALRRPVWNVRWAVSIAVRGSEDVSDPDPIREGATTPGRRMAGGGGGPSYDDSGAMEEQMQMQMQMEMEEMNSAMSGYDDMNSMSMTPSAKKPVIKSRDMLNAEAETVMSENLGLVAEMIAEEFTKRFTAGDYGPLFKSVTAPAPADPRASMVRSPIAAPVVANPEMSAELDELLSIAPDSLTMWKPGLSYVGMGASDEMLLVAKREGIEFLLHFDVLLKPGRGDKTQNVSRCRMFHVASGKQMALSKGIDNLEAAQMVGTGRSADERAYINDQIAALLGIMDRDTKAVSMPQNLSAEAAKGRVAMLLGSPKAKSLHTLAEIRLYQTMGLLTAEEVEMAFDIVGGSEALLFLHGPREERLAMARKWAGRSAPSAKP